MAMVLDTNDPTTSPHTMPLILPLGFVSAVNLPILKISTFSSGAFLAVNCSDQNIMCRSVTFFSNGWTRSVVIPKGPDAMPLDAKREFFETHPSSNSNGVWGITRQLGFAHDGQEYSKRAFWREWPEIFGGKKKKTPNFGPLFLTPSRKFHPVQASVGFPLLRLRLGLNFNMFSFFVYERQAYDFHEESLFQLSFFRTHKYGETRILCSCPKRKSSRHMETERIRILF